MEQNKKNSFTTILSATLLVAGASIGGGMLALPVATGINGFIPSLLVMAVCWAMMTYTGLLLAETSLWMEKDVHVDTMTHKLLGNFGRVISWILYLFVAYASIVAYTAAGGSQLQLFFSKILNVEITKEIGCLIYIVTFGLVLYLGNQVVGRVNAILFAAMIAAYIGLIGTSVDEIHISYLSYSNWNGFLLSIPLMLAAFSYQTMVPSLTPILNRDRKTLKWAVIVGTSITFFVYAIWQTVMLGIIPVNGPNGLAESLIQGEAVTNFLGHHIQNGYLVSIAHFFAFFAVVTSFLGMSLGLFDFLADGLKIKKKGFGNIVLGLLIVIPTYFSAVYFERVFIAALDSSGGYGDTILNGLIPLAMAWVGRYHLNYPNTFKLRGGKALMLIAALFFTGCLLIEILVHLGIISSVYEAYNLVEKKLES